MPDCKQDANTHEWTVDLDRAGSGRRTMKTKHIVMATGFACRPKVPEVEGIDTVEETVRHSTEHDSSKGWEGKKIMVVGSGASGMEIAFEAREYTPRPSATTTAVLMNVQLGEAWT